MDNTRDSTRSSSVVTLARPASSSSLKTTDRSFRYASPCLWNQLPLYLRKPYSGTSSSISCLPIPPPTTSSSSDLPLCTSITPSLFHSRLKTYLFHKSYPLSFSSSSRTASTDFCLHRFFWATRFLIFIFSIFFVSGPCARLSWPSRQLLSARKSTVSYRIVSYHHHHHHLFAQNSYWQQLTICLCSTAGQKSTKCSNNCP